MKGSKWVSQSRIKSIIVSVYWYNELILRALDLLDAVQKTQSSGTSVWQVTLQTVDFSTFRDCFLKCFKCFFLFGLPMLGA